MHHSNAFPPNHTALTKPMDQPIIQFFKQHYMKKSVTDSCIDRVTKKYWKTFPFQFLNALPPSSIVSSWRNLRLETVPTLSVSQINFFQKS